MERCHACICTNPGWSGLSKPTVRNWQIEWHVMEPWVVIFGTVEGVPHVAITLEKCYLSSLAARQHTSSGGGRWKIAVIFPREMSMSHCSRVRWWVKLCKQSIAATTEFNPNFHPALSLTVSLRFSGFLPPSKPTRGISYPKCEYVCAWCPAMNTHQCLQYSHLTR